MDLGFKLILSNQNLKHPTSRQIFGDTSGLLCKNDQILRPKDNEIYIWTYASDIETKLQMFFRELLLQICLIRKVEKNGFIDLASDDDWGSFSFLKFRVSFRNSLKVIDKKIDPPCVPLAILVIRVVGHGWVESSSEAHYATMWIVAALQCIDWNGKQTCKA